MGNCCAAINSGAGSVIIDSGPFGMQRVNGSKIICCPCLHHLRDVQLGVENYKLNITDVATKSFVPLNIEAEVKIKPDYVKPDSRNPDGSDDNKDPDRGIAIYAQAWGDINKEDMRLSIQTLLEGHLRGVVSQLTVEQVLSDKKQLGLLIDQDVSPELAKLGLIFSSADSGFNIKEISDDVGYLHHFGLHETARRLAKADIEVTEKQCQSAIKQAEYRSRQQIETKTARTDETVQESKYLMSKIDAEKTLELQTLESKRDENLQKYKFMAIKEKKRAVDEKRFEIETATQQIKQVAFAEKAKLREAEQKVRIERKKAIEQKLSRVDKVARTQLERAKIEAQAKIEEEEGLARAAAEAKVKAAETVFNVARSDAKTRKTFVEAEAAAHVKKEKARAAVLANIGEAEIAIMREKAEAYNRYGGAVLLEQIAEMLPKIAARVSAPLSQVGSTVFLQSDEGGWPQYIMSVREVVETITGVDLVEVGVSGLDQQPTIKMARP